MPVKLLKKLSVRFVKRLDLNKLKSKKEKTFLTLTFEFLFFNEAGSFIYFRFCTGRRVPRVCEVKSQKIGTFRLGKELI